MQPDTLIPGVANPQSWNRFSYVVNNPIRFNDPTGHVCSDPENPNPSCEGSANQTTRVGNKMIRGNGKTVGGCGGRGQLRCGTQTRVYGPPAPYGPPVLLGYYSNHGTAPNAGASVVSNGLSVVASASDFATASLGSTHPTANGNAALSASPYFTETYGLQPGGNYLPKTIAKAIGKNLIDGSERLSTAGVTGLISIGANLYDDSYGNHAGEGLGQEFLVSTAVDTVLGIAIGIATATLITLAVASTSIVFAPVTIIGLTMGAGLLIGLGFEHFGITNVIKDDVNYVIDLAQGD